LLAKLNDRTLHPELPPGRPKDITVVLTVYDTSRWRGRVGYFNAINKELCVGVLSRASGLELYMPDVLMPTFNSWIGIWIEVVGNRKVPIRARVTVFSTIFASPTFRYINSCPFEFWCNDSNVV
jgi:hypothetical protein